MSSLEREVSEKEKNEQSDSDSSTEYEVEEIEDEDEAELMNALQNAMKNPIIFSIQPYDEDEELQLDEEEEEEDEEEEDDEDDPEWKPKSKKRGSRSSNYESESESESEPKRTKKENNVESKTKKDRKIKKPIEKASKTRSKDERVSKTRAMQKMKAKKEKKESQSTDDFDYQTALNELKTLFENDASNAPQLMKEQFERLQSEYKSKQEEKKKREDKKKALEYTKKFRELLRRKRGESDLMYFRKLPIEKQQHYLEQFKVLKNESSVKVPYTIKLLESPIPNEFKAIALKKVSMLENMEPGMGEYFKVKQWVDMFMGIPFGIHRELPVNLEKDGVEKCHAFMNDAKNTLDESVYGLNDAKMQIMQMLGQLMTNPSSVGTAIAIKGPMGTGKTTLVKDGISRVLGRPFVFVPLGGATDSSYLEGHSYTYEGSTWGRIIDAIVKCKCMNPVFYFDELDKVSDTPRGEEIIGILTHLTDTTQNSQFHDKYFADLDFDLSKALFIFSYNYEDKINPILRDRMYRIETKGYDAKDKITISRRYLIPHIIQNVKFEKDMITIPDESINEIISNHTDDEKGVRNLKRCLETIYTKINLYRLMPKEGNAFDDVSIQVKFPFNVTTDVVNKLLKRGDPNQSFMSMYL
jgi:ATP-dependent Lon protease